MSDPRTLPLERKYRATARWYDLLDWPWERQYRRWRPDIVGDLDGRVVEVGVGTGRNLAYYPPGIELVAVDLSEAMLARARPRARGARCDVSLVQGDALDLEMVPSASTDWYIATFLYCVLPDTLQRPALAEMRRVLAPGGRFRLVEIVRSERFLQRLPQTLLAPFVERVYGAGFDRRTRLHIEATAGLEITDTRWLKEDTHLLLEGRRVDT